MRTVAFKVQPGLELTIKGIRWDAGWEFDCPVAIISPVFKSYEDGCSLEHAVESLLIDACIDGVMKTEDPNSWEWRGWSAGYLQRKYYRKGVERVKQKIRFVLDEDGELAWTEIFKP